MTHIIHKEERQQQGQPTDAPGTPSAPSWPWSPSSRFPSSPWAWACRPWLLRWEGGWVLSSSRVGLGSNEHVRDQLTPGRGHPCLIATQHEPAVDWRTGACRAQDEKGRATTAAGRLARCPSRVPVSKGQCYDSGVIHNSRAPSRAPTGSSRAAGVSQTVLARRRREQQRDLRRLVVRSQGTRGSRREGSALPKKQKIPVDGWMCDEWISKLVGEGLGRLADRWGMDGMTQYHKRHGREGKCSSPSGCVPFAPPQQPTNDPRPPKPAPPAGCVHVFGWNGQSIEAAALCFTDPKQRSRAFCLSVCASSSTRTSSPQQPNNNEHYRASRADNTLMVRC